MINFIDIYSFIPVGGCVGIDPQCSALFWVYNAVKTALDEVERWKIRWALVDI
ncbi:MAG: hypothetical protein NZ824_06325 [Candidatus Thioglobus sp.]|nr:hypothetical protein [Candidatus Thioglobus sp.]